MAWEQLLFSRHLEGDENLQFVVHKHWLLLLKPSFKTALFGLLMPAVVTWFFPGFFWFAVAWCGLSWLYFIFQFIDWYFDAWLATSTSLIKVEWRGLFHQLSSRIPYSEIKEIAAEVDGFWGTIFGVGKTSICTSGGTRFEMRPVARPRKIELDINDMRARFLAEHSFMQKDALQSLISDLVLTHIQERGIRIRRT